LLRHVAFCGADLGVCVELVHATPRITVTPRSCAFPRRIAHGPSPIPMKTPEKRAKTFFANPGFS
jgi:hypothetical protein